MQKKRQVPLLQTQKRNSGAFKGIYRQLRFPNTGITMKEITVQELKDLLDAKADFVLLDCRSEKQFREEHITGAMNLHVETIEKYIESRVPNKNTLLVTSCGGYTCSVSVTCYEKLARLGYTNLKEYAGGLAEWKANGYETQKG